MKSVTSGPVNVGVPVADPETRGTSFMTYFRRTIRPCPLAPSLDLLLSSN